MFYDNSKMYPSDPKGLFRETARTHHAQAVRLLCCNLKVRNASHSAKCYLVLRSVMPHICELVGQYRREGSVQRSSTEARWSPTASPSSRRHRGMWDFAVPLSRRPQPFLSCYAPSCRGDNLFGKSISQRGPAMLAEKFFLVLETIRSIASDRSVRVISTTPHIPVKVPPQK